MLAEQADDTRQRDIFACDKLLALLVKHHRELAPPQLLKRKPKPETKPIDNAVLTVNEAVRVFGFSESTIRKWCQRHGVGDRRGGRWVVVRDRIDQYIALINQDHREAYNAMLRDQLARQKSAAQNKSLFQRIVAAVCLEFTITQDELYSVRRMEPIVRARQAAAYLTNRFLKGWSLVRIGREFQRDHTTIIHGINAIRERRRSDPNLDKSLCRLEAEFFNG